MSLRLVRLRYPTQREAPKLNAWDASRSARPSAIADALSALPLLTRQRRAPHTRSSLQYFVRATVVPGRPPGLQALSRLASEVSPQVQGLIGNADTLHNAESCLKGQAVLLHEPKDPRTGLTLAKMQPCQLLMLKGEMA